MVFLFSHTFVFSDAYEEFDCTHQMGRCDEDLLCTGAGGSSALIGGRRGILGMGGGGGGDRVGGGEMGGISEKEGRGIAAVDFGGVGWHEAILACLKEDRGLITVFLLEGLSGFFMRFRLPESLLLILSIVICISINGCHLT